MIVQGDLTGSYYTILMLGVIVIIMLRIRHMLLDIHRTRLGLLRFLTCHGKERWGPRARVKEWQRNVIRHLIAQRDTLDNDIWLMKNRRNNLEELKKEEQKKLSELELSEINARTLDDTDKFLFIKFEITLNKAKIEDLRNRIQQKDTSIHSMEQARDRAKKCLASYSKGENPRLPVIRYIRGLFFDLR